ncbi:MAG TPA: glycosyltransferase family protein [Lacibacter sp.]|nr:glycosyltransferase family protein [Lacibacter sp.]HMO88520.1 glycosyltransferase family protein [Lacibacter sp.]
MKFIFAIQGEGRGHLTQAIALGDLLRAQGHEIAAVLVGSSHRREIPSFVRERIPAPFRTYPSPNFVTDKDNKSIRLGKTVCHTLLRIGRYRRSMQLIRDTVARHRPDVLINFYEPLVGLCHLFGGLPVTTISIAHQYIYLHPQFHFPAGSPAKDRGALRWYTRLTAMGSRRLLALSFYPLSQPVHKNIRISPPLLRSDVSRQEVFPGNHILVYLLNAGYMQDIIRWHSRHPQYELHCFTDSPTVKGKWQYHDNLYFHSLDDQKFLRYMANSRAVVTTAGFESVCEALYLGKPVLMVPVQGHFEQWCNARDGAKAGAGTYADRFDLDVLLHYLPHYQNTAESFRSWAQQTEKIVLDTIADLTRTHTPTTPLPAAAPPATLPRILPRRPEEAKQM